MELATGIKDKKNSVLQISISLPNLYLIQYNTSYKIMKSFFTYLGLALLFLVIESTLLYHVLPSFLIPDVILIMVFHLGFNNRSTSGALTAFTLGYLADVFSGWVIGTSSFAFVFVFVITSMLAKIVSLNSIMIKIGGAIFMSILKGILAYLLLRLTNEEIPLYTIFTTAISTGIASPFIINLLKNSAKILPYRSMEKTEV